MLDRISRDTPAFITFVILTGGPKPSLTDARRNSSGHNEDKKAPAFPFHQEALAERKAGAERYRVSCCSQANYFNSYCEGFTFQPSMAMALAERSTASSTSAPSARVSPGNKVT